MIDLQQYVEKLNRKLAATAATGEAALARVRERAKKDLNLGGVRRGDVMRLRPSCAFECPSADDYGSQGFFFTSKDGPDRRISQTDAAFWRTILVDPTSFLELLLSFELPSVFGRHMRHLRRNACVCTFSLVLCPCLCSCLCNSFCPFVHACNPVRSCACPCLASRFNWRLFFMRKYW